MTTPIVDFVRAYAAKDGVRLHMPGHKGKPALGCEPLDITEVAGADVLYHETGVIAESEQNATALFGSAATLYSCEGATLAIKTIQANFGVKIDRYAMVDFDSFKDIIIRFKSSYSSMLP